MNQLTAMHLFKQKIVWCAVALSAAGVGGCLEEPISGGSSEDLTSSQFHCASDNNRFNTCDVGGKIASVRLMRQVSHTRCVEAKPAVGDTPATPGNWGFTRGENFIFVDKGCRADFQVAYLEQLNCSSINDAPQRCATTLTNIQSVRLVRRFSHASCVEGSSFGFDNEGIFVDRGCRGMFEVVGSRRSP